MNRLLRAIVALLFIGICLDAAHPLGVAAETDLQLDDSQLARVQKGEILVRLVRSGQQPRGSVEAVVWIDASAETVWRIMTDCDAAPRYIPGLKACKILESGDNWEIIRHDVKWMWLFPRVAYVFRADYQLYRQISFQRISGDLREMSGRWRLSPMDDGRRTIVHYRVYLDPGFMVPGFLVRRSLKKSLLAVLIALRDRVENAGGKTPP